MVQILHNHQEKNNS